MMEYIDLCAGSIHYMRICTEMLFIVELIVSKRVLNLLNIQYKIILLYASFEVSNQGCQQC